MIHIHVHCLFVQLDKPVCISSAWTKVEAKDKTDIRRTEEDTVLPKYTAWIETKDKVTEIISSNGNIYLSNNISFAHAVMIDCEKIFLAPNSEKDLTEILRPWLSKANFLPEEGNRTLTECIEMVPLFMQLVKEDFM